MGLFGAEEGWSVQGFSFLFHFILRFDWIRSFSFPLNYLFSIRTVTLNVKKFCNVSEHAPGLAEFGRTRVASSGNVVSEDTNRKNERR